MLQNVAAQRAPSPGPLALKPSLSPPLPAPAPAPSRSASPSSSSSSSTATRKKDDGCDIKGNVSSNGSKRYHVPETVFYDSVKIDESKGERWFCSEEDAEKAGWKKAQYGGRPSKKAKDVEAAPSTDTEAKEAAAVAAAADNNGEEGAQV